MALLQQIFVFGLMVSASIDVWLDILIFWEGVILDAILNAPGSWHDSCVALPVYEQLLHNTPKVLIWFLTRLSPRAHHVSVGNKGTPQTRRSLVQQPASQE